MRRSGVGMGREVRQHVLGDLVEGLGQRPFVAAELQADVVDTGACMACSSASRALRPPRSPKRQRCSRASASATRSRWMKLAYGLLPATARQRHARAWSVACPGRPGSHPCAGRSTPVAAGPGRPRTTAGPGQPQAARPSPAAGARRRLRAAMRSARGSGCPACRNRGRTAGTPPGGRHWLRPAAGGLRSAAARCAPTSRSATAHGSAAPPHRCPAGCHR